MTDNPLLIALALDQIKVDFNNGDDPAVELLLTYIPEEILNEYVFGTVKDSDQNG